jgi:hypothetical protein
LVCVLATSTITLMLQEVLFETLVKHLGSLVRVLKQSRNLSFLQLLEILSCLLHNYFAQEVRSVRVINGYLASLIDFWNYELHLR